MYVIMVNDLQVVQCTHLLVFTARNDAGPTVERMITSHGLESSGAGGVKYAQTLRNSLSGMDSATFLNWSTSQAL